MEFQEVLNRRRTVRDFRTDISVSDEQLERILDAAFKAPTNDHLRQIEFVVVRGQENIAKIIAPVQDNTDKLQSTWLKANEGIMDQCKYDMYADALPKQKRMLMEADCLILPFFRCKAEHFPTVKEQEELNSFASVWCSIENILLAATNEGLSCVFRIPINDEIEHVKKLVNCPDGWQLACLLTIGYKAPDAAVIKQKEVNIKDRIHKNHF